MERLRKTKIGTEVAHVTRDSDTTFKVKRSKVKVTGGRAYCGGLPHSLFGIVFSSKRFLKPMTKSNALLSHVIRHFTSIPFLYYAPPRGALSDDDV